MRSVYFLYWNMHKNDSVDSCTYPDFNPQPISVSEDVPSPWEDNTLLEKKLIKKKEEVLDHAIDTCKKYGHHERYDCFPIKVLSVPCEGSTPIERVHERVKSVSNATARKIVESEELSEMKEDYQFLVSHCCRKSYQLQFSRCNQDSCEHCRTTPIRAKRFLSIVWFQKISIPPHRGFFSSLTPTPLDFPFQRALRYSPYPLEFPWFFPLGPSYPLEIPNPKKDLIYFDLLRAVIKIKFS